MSDFPKTSSSSNPKARKEHRCCECRGVIQIGERYHVFWGVWDAPATFKTCEDCEQLRRDVGGAIRDPEDYPAFGSLYEHLFNGDRDDCREFVKRFMDTRRKRNAPESPRGWMENREIEMNS